VLLGQGTGLRRLQLPRSHRKLRTSAPREISTATEARPGVGRSIGRRRQRAAGNGDGSFADAAQYFATPPIPPRGRGGPERRQQTRPPDGPRTQSARAVGQRRRHARRPRNWPPASSFPWPDATVGRRSGSRHTASVLWHGWLVRSRSRVYAAGQSPSAGSRCPNSTLADCPVPSGVSLLSPCQVPHGPRRAYRRRWRSTYAASARSRRRCPAARLTFVRRPMDRPTQVRAWLSP